MTFKALNDILNVRDDSISLSVSIFLESNNQKELFKSYYQNDDLSLLDQSDIPSSLESQMPEHTSPQHTSLTPAIDSIVLITVDSTVVPSFAA